MDIFLNASQNSNEYEVVNLLKKKKLDTDEEIVRRELVRVWTRLLEQYARPGAFIPPVDLMRRELISKGVDAAVSAVLDEHWFVFSWMIHDDIQRRIEQELDRFDLVGFLEDVRIAQTDPQMLNRLRQEIRNHILLG